MRVVGLQGVPTTIQDIRRRLAPVIVQEEAKPGHCTTASPYAMVALVNNYSAVCTIAEAQRSWQTCALPCGRMQAETEPVKDQPLVRVNGCPGTDDDCQMMWKRSTEKNSLDLTVVFCFRSRHPLPSTRFPSSRNPGPDSLADIPSYRHLDFSGLLPTLGIFDLPLPAARNVNDPLPAATPTIHSPDSCRAETILYASSNLCLTAVIQSWIPRILIDISGPWGIKASQRGHHRHLPLLLAAVCSGSSRIVVLFLVSPICGRPNSISPLLQAT